MKEGKKNKGLLCHIMEYFDGRFFPIATAHWRLQAGGALQLHRFKQQKITKMIKTWLTCGACNI